MENEFITKDGRLFFRISTVEPDDYTPTEKIGADLAHEELLKLLRKKGFKIYYGALVEE